MPGFEWTFKFGDILTLVGALFVGAAFLYRRGGVDVKTSMILSALTDDMSEMKQDMKIFATSITELAAQKIQINLLMKWYDELRRGVGKIE